MDKPSVLKVFSICWMIMFGIILSMIGPAQSFESYMVHYAIAMLPAGLMTAAVISSWDDFWKLYFVIEVEKVINNG